MHIDKNVKLGHLLAKLARLVDVLTQSGPKLKAAISEARDELLKRSGGKRVPGA